MEICCGKLERRCPIRLSLKLLTAARAGGLLLIIAAIAKFVDGKIFPIWLSSEFGLPRDWASWMASTLNVSELLLGMVLLAVPLRGAFVGAVAFAIAGGYHLAALLLPQVRLCPCMGGLLTSANPYVLHSSLLIVSAGTCSVYVALLASKERAPQCPASLIAPSPS
jgi:hypothetical protein